MSYHRIIAPIGVNDKDYTKLRQQSLTPLNNKKNKNTNDYNKCNSNKDIILRLYNYLTNQCIITILDDNTIIKEYDKPEMLYKFTINCDVYHPPFIYANTLVILIFLYIIPYIIYYIIPYIRIYYIPYIIRMISSSSSSSSTASTTASSSLLSSEYDGVSIVSLYPGYYIKSFGFQSGLGLNLLYILVLGIILKKGINHYSNPKHQHIVTLKNIEWIKKWIRIDWIIWIVRVLITLSFIIIPTLSYNVNTLLDMSVLLLGLSLDLIIIDNKNDNKKH